MTLPLTHLYSGKVRDIYAVGDDQLLMVTSDRLSAFDVVLDEPILHKGRVLNGHADDVVRAARSAGVRATKLGGVSGDRIVVRGILDVGITDVTSAWRGRLPEALGAGTTH